VASSRASWTRLRAEESTTCYQARPVLTWPPSPMPPLRPQERPRATGASGPAPALPANPGGSRRGLLPRHTRRSARRARGPDQPLHWYERYLAENPSGGYSGRPGRRLVLLESRHDRAPRGKRPLVLAKFPPAPTRPRLGASSNPSFDHSRNQGERGHSSRQPPTAENAEVEERRGERGRRGGLAGIVRHS